MKHSFFIFIGLIITAACTTSSIEDSRERILTGDFEAYNSLPTCECSELEIDSSFSYRRNDSLFTGTCYIYFDSTQRVSAQKQIFRGKPHGLFSLFTPAGDTLKNVLYKNGRKINEIAVTPYFCNCDSLNTIRSSDGISRKALHGYYYSGDCFTYFDDSDSILRLKKSFERGYLEGKLYEFNVDGDTIAITNYVQGKEIY